MAGELPGVSNIVFEGVVVDAKQLLMVLSGECIFRNACLRVRAMNKGVIHAKNVTFETIPPQQGLGLRGGLAQMSGK